MDPWTRCCTLNMHSQMLRFVFRAGPTNPAPRKSFSVGRIIIIITKVFVTEHGTEHEPYLWLICISNLHFGFFYFFLGQARWVSRRAHHSQGCIIIIVLLRLLLPLLLLLLPLLHHYHYYDYTTTTTTTTTASTTTTTTTTATTTTTSTTSTKRTIYVAVERG